MIWDAYSNRLIDHMVWNELYETGIREPNHPLPVIPLAVKYDYCGCLNIDEVTDPEDPIIVYMWDSWGQCNA